MWRNAYGNTHQYSIVPIEEYRKRFMSTAIDTYFNSSYKIWYRFLCKRRKISAAEFREILAMIEKNQNNFVHLSHHNLIWNQLQSIYLNLAACCSCFYCVPLFTA
jgi:hypothetical protein